MVWPDGRQLKLFEESIAQLDLAAQRRQPVRSALGKNYVEPPGPGTEGHAPLAAIYILRDQVLPGTGGIERLSPLNGAQALLDQSYRPGLALAMARGSRQVSLTAAVLRHAQIFTLARPRDLGRIGETADELFAHWRGL